MITLNRTQIRNVILRYDALYNGMVAQREEQEAYIEESKGYWLGESGEAYRKAHCKLIREGAYAKYLEAVKEIRDIFDESMPYLNELQNMCAEMPNQLGQCGITGGPTEVLMLNENYLDTFNDQIEETLRLNQLTHDVMESIMDGCEGLCDVGITRRLNEEAYEQQSRLRNLLDYINLYAVKLKKLVCELSDRYRGILHKIVEQPAVGITESTNDYAWDTIRRILVEERGWSETEADAALYYLQSNNPTGLSQLELSNQNGAYPAYDKQLDALLAECEDYKVIQEQVKTICVNYLVLDPKINEYFCALGLGDTLAENADIIESAERMAAYFIKNYPQLIYNQLHGINELAAIQQIVNTLMLPQERVCLGMPIEDEAFFELLKFLEAEEMRIINDGVIEGYNEDSVYIEKDVDSGIYYILPQAVATDDVITIGIGHAIESNREAVKEYLMNCSQGYTESEIDDFLNGIDSYEDENGNYSRDELVSYLHSLPVSENLLAIPTTDAETLMREDYNAKMDVLVPYLEDSGYYFDITQIEAMGSVLYNGTSFEDPESVMYYYIRNDVEGAISVMHSVYGDNGEEPLDGAGSFRRRLMELNLFANGVIQYCSVEGVDDYCVDIGYNKEDN